MKKALVMAHSSLEVLLIESIREEPGCTSKRLWDLAKDWNSKLLGVDFDDALALLLQQGYRVTSKRWYLPGEVVTLRPPNAKQNDARQLRMFG